MSYGYTQPRYENLQKTKMTLNPCESFHNLMYKQCFTHLNIVSIKGMSGQEEANQNLQKCYADNQEMLRTT